MNIRQYVCGAVFAVTLNCAPEIEIEIVQRQYQPAAGYDLRLVKYLPSSSLPNYVMIGVGTLAPKTKAFRGPVIFGSDKDGDCIMDYMRVFDNSDDALTELREKDLSLELQPLASLDALTALERQFLSFYCQNELR